jgi:hypothetical protein
MFECGSCCFHEQDKGIGECSSVGYYLTPGRNTTSRDILLYIQEYTCRELTFQSDILNGFKGVLRFYTATEDPQYQYWGLPISTSPYKDTPNDDTLSTNETLATAVAVGLSWSRWSNDGIYVGNGTRRHGFPSWSWCGWTISPVWQRSGSRVDVSSIPKDIRIEHLDGSTMPLSEEFAASLFRDEYLSTSFTYNLHMRVVVLDVRIVYLDSAIAFPLVSYSHKTRYAAQAVRETQPDDSERNDEEPLVRLWPMEPTLDMDEHHGMHTKLCNQVLQCVLLGPCHPHNRGWCLRKNWPSARLGER